MNVTVLYVGSSLLAPLKEAEQEINRAYKLELRIAAPTLARRSTMMVGSKWTTIWRKPKLFLLFT